LAVAFLIKKKKSVKQTTAKPWLNDFDISRFATAWPWLFFDREKEERKANHGQAVVERH